MAIFSACLVILVAMPPVLACDNGDCTSQRLVKGWEFYQGDLGGIWEGLRKENSSNLPQWECVTLPHCFNAFDSVDPDVAYYQGPSWYRRTIKLSNPYHNGRTLLFFEGAGQKTHVYVGDELVKEHIGGYDEFQVDITEAIQRENSTDGNIPILVRCDNSRNLEAIPSDLSDFNLYGGLYRYVNLVYLPEISIGNVRIDTSIDEKLVGGEVLITANLYNPIQVSGPATLEVVLTDPRGYRVAKVEKHIDDTLITEQVDFSISLPNPTLWSPDTPHLYNCSLTLKKSDLSHQVEHGVGFRHFKFEKKGPFFLNGKRLLLRGTHRHEDHSGLAAAMPEELIRKELEMMKEVGINFLRLGHYQQSRIVLDLCDELGFLVWEEIPWCRGGLGGEAYKSMAERMLRNMISQHRHHPSVIIWGLGNENDWPGDFSNFDKQEIRSFMKKLNELAHELDPGRVTSIRRCKFCANVVDVYSPSIWAGWYRGKYTDYKQVSLKEMESVDRFIHAEWGASHHARRHSETPDKGLDAVQAGNADERSGDYLLTGGAPRVSRDSDWTETYACNLIDWHLKEQENMPWLTGAAYWPFKDFSTPIRPLNPVPYVNQKGIVERDLTPKESYFVFQSYWTTKPMVHIYGHTWPVRWGKEGEDKLVKVYSNCSEVELFLNGQAVGRRERNSQNFPAAGLRWIVQFQEGLNNLKAVGKLGQENVVDQISLEYQIKEWSAPTQLELKVVEEGSSQVTVQVYALDANGVRCLDAKHFVCFDLTGDGKLIDNLGTSVTSRKVQLYNGRAQISLIKNNGKSMVSVSSAEADTKFLLVQ